MLFNRILTRLVKLGDLTVTDWKGRVFHYGDGSGPKVHVKFASAAAARKIAFDPDLYLGEAFTSGEFSMIEGRIYDFMELALRNTNATGSSATNLNSAALSHKLLYSARFAFRRLDQRNNEKKAKDNVHRHYDLDSRLYDLFLDSDRQYSCAYFETDDATLEEAQLAKKRHIAAKLDIKPGMDVLDIGCGWGGMGIYLAKVCGANVVGVTLSEEQLKIANDRAKAEGLSDRVQFLLQDYRTIDKKFDRIVSVGMFEHVGVGHYGEFFKKVSSLLKPDGVTLLHSINRSDGPGATSAWIHKYIFPGGYIPSLSEVTPHLEKHGLYVTDIEILRMHYARTLRHWIDRFLANREKAKELYDERFCRMWEFYLAGSEAMFRYIGANNFQIQFCKSQHVLPYTRDYLMAAEDRLRQIEKQVLAAPAPTAKAKLPPKKLVAKKPVVKRQPAKV